MLNHSGIPECRPRYVCGNENAAYVGTEGVHPAKDASGKPIPTNGYRKGTFYRLTEASIPVVMRSVDIHLELHISSVIMQPNSPAPCFLRHFASHRDGSQSR